MNFVQELRSTIERGVFSLNISKSSPYRLGVAALCTMIGVLVHISGLQLLFPLAQGLVENDFSTVRDRFGIIAKTEQLFPQLFSSPHVAFFPIALVALLLIVIKNLIEYTAEILVKRETRRAESNIRHLLFSRYLTFGKLYFDRHNSSEVYHVIMSHSNSFAEQLRAYHRFFAQGLSLMAIFGMLSYISWRLTLVSLLVLPLFFIGSHSLVSRVRLTAKASEKLLGNIRHRIFNIVSCMPLVKVSGAESEEEQLFQKECALERESSSKVDSMLMLVRPIEEIATFISLLSIAAVMSFVRVQEGSTSVSPYLVFFYALQLTLPRLNIFNEFRMSMARSQVAMESFKKIVSDDEKFIVPSGSREFGGISSHIQIRNLMFEYPKRPGVLKGISLTIPQGKTTALVGATGAGKSTLLSLLLRFYDCPSGTIFLDDNDIREFSLRSLMSRISYVSQDALLFDETLRFNLLYGLATKPTHDEIESALASAQLEECVKKLPQGLDTYCGERGVQLSGGEKQRVAIARALLKKADILLLDEATSALDSQTEARLQAAISTALTGKTILVVAHRLSTIAHADKVAVLSEGSIIEEGTLAELLNHQDHFYRLWEAQRILSI